MKYSGVILAYVLAVAAAAEYNNGQYIPEKQYNNKYNQYKPYRYQQYQNNPYKPYVSSTPFPSLFVSSTPVPVTVAPARSTVYYTSTPKPVFNIPALPSRSVSIEPVKPTLASALPSRSIIPARATVQTPSWSSRASWPSAKAELPIVPTQAAFPASASVTKVEAPVVPVVPAARLASWPSPKVDLPVAPTQAAFRASASVTKFEAPVVPVVPAARLASWPSAKPLLPIAPTQSIAKVEAPVVSVVPAARFAAVASPIAPVVSVTPAAPVASAYPAPKTALPVTKYINDAGAAETLKYSNQINSDGDFQYSYETNNGIYAQESGSHRSFYNGEDQVAPVVAQGSFGWTSPEGQQISMSYVADELGYRPTGPQVHPQLARALEYLTARNLQVSH